MSTEPLFQTQLVLGYVAWLLCFSAYVLPWLKSIPIIYVPALMITHVAAFYLLLRPQSKTTRPLTGAAAAS